MMTANEGALLLDKADLTILSALARNCRSSYSGIGSDVGLTSKSVKTRVKKMIRYRTEISEIAREVGISIISKANSCRL
ncbi:MAG TPA: AsnC family protein [Phototrophicaceae bacterium]|nr:AsnC family protein [Phototrophicaceae bacterium]